MIKHDALGSRWAAILNLHLQPVAARLRQPRAIPSPVNRLQPPAPASRSDPPKATPEPERRDIAGRERLLRRIRGEFDEMPGLAVTAAEAAKLFGLPLDAGAARRILQELVSLGVLRITDELRYVLCAHK